MSDFVKTAIEGLEKLTTLQVNTLVGNYKFINEKEKQEGGDVEPDYTKLDPTSTDERMSSVINLISGDISTAMTDKFATEFKELRDYHLIREAQGQEIIRKNIQVLKDIAEAISNRLSKKD
ncbi:MAG: hypothetical protein IPH20_04875 [Bacteroidales bacterium]|nr:hypothetical protein [Bacteroidales bacterium]